MTQYNITQYNEVYLCMRHRFFLSQCSCFCYNMIFIIRPRFDIWRYPWWSVAIQHDTVHSIAIREICTNIRNSDAAFQSRLLKATHPYIASDRYTPMSNMFPFPNCFHAVDVSAKVLKCLFILASAFLNRIWNLEHSMSTFYQWGCVCLIGMNFPQKLWPTGL